jgi:Ca-activated chloride channel homolog
MRTPLLSLLFIFTVFSVTAQQNQALQWRVSPDNPVYLRNGRDPMYLYLDLKGNSAPQQKKRAPLNLSIVIDRSGSMQGDKIKYARQAAMFVIDQLGAEDFVSIVQYDHTVEVISSSAAVQNKEIIKSKIEKIVDRGSTNMTGGMLKGYDEVAISKKEGFVNRVLLMTDGLANVGITDSAQICRIAEKKCKELGISISTFGIGADYNENLLTAIAETGCGNYYFIENPDKIPAIFAEELQGLLSVMALNVSIELEFPAEFLKAEKVYGYPSVISNGKSVINFNDVYSQEEKGVVVQLSRIKDLPEQLTFTARISYNDALSLNVVKEEKKIILTSNPDPLIVMKSVDTLVDEMVTLYKSTEMFDEVLLEMDKGNFAAAKAKAETVKAYVAIKATRAKSARLVKQSETIKNYADNIGTYQTMNATEQKNFQKSGKAMNYKAKKGKQ